MLTTVFKIIGLIRHYQYDLKILRNFVAYGTNTKERPISQGKHLKILKWGGSSNKIGVGLTILRNFLEWGVDNKMEIELFVFLFSLVLHWSCLSSSNEL